MYIILLNIGMSLQHLNAAKSPAALEYEYLMRYKRHYTASLPHLSLACKSDCFFISEDHCEGCPLNLGHAFWG